MKKRVKEIIIASSILIVVIIIALTFRPKEKYTYEWVKVGNSSVGQYLLYINNSKGQHINGTARLVYINGKTKRVDVSEDGLLYVKGIVSEVRNPNKR